MDKWVELIRIEPLLPEALSILRRTRETEIATLKRDCK